MTPRDLHWRLGGLALFAAAGGLGLVSNADAVKSNAGLSGSLGLLAFLLYLAGAVLVIQGERLPRAWQPGTSRGLSNRRTGGKPNPGSAGAPATDPVRSARAVQDHLE